MTLALRNAQRAVPLRRAPLRRRLQALRAVLGVRDFDLGVICVDNERMRRINRTYRGSDAPTDVLSFPLHEVRGCALLASAARRPARMPCADGAAHVRFQSHFENSRIYTQGELAPVMADAHHWREGGCREVEGRGSAVLKANQS